MKPGPVPFRCLLDLISAFLIFYRKGEGLEFTGPFRNKERVCIYNRHLFTWYNWKNIKSLCSLHANKMNNKIT
jgi:hypothetical protein